MDAFVLYSITHVGVSEDLHNFYYRVTLVVTDLGWVDLYFDVPMSA